MNQRILKVLEFNKIIEKLCEYTASEMGKAEAEVLEPAGSLSDVLSMLSETEEADAILKRSGKTPVEGYPDIREMLKHIHATLFLTSGELLKVAACLHATRHAREILEGNETEPALSLLSQRLPSYRNIEEQIASCILAEGEIADNASVTLAGIRRQMRLVNEKVRDRLNGMVKSQSTQKYLQEPIITMRDGRYTLAVKAEYRTQVPGLIHDASGSGATLFVEPAAVVELGNEMKKLAAQEQAEIERILATLTAKVDPVADEMLLGMEVLAKIDLVFAKAMLSKDMKAVCPKINEEGRICIRKGRHPLLDPDTVVPVDVWNGEEFSTLIITGPNTGGKTVTLKTVGLLSLMAMTGIFVPAENGTELSVFHEIFADIGDEQSIEQSLSTFSSHMKNIVGILEHADERSLVLLDELGAGTDPVEGAALAQAILEALFQQGAKTFATTHYSEIKAFALTYPGMQNASMEFDIDRLCPTYHLYIGIPGKSNAFEISKRLGLDGQIIERAGEFLQKKDVAFEDVISGAEKARMEAEKMKQAASADLEQAEEIKNRLQKEKDKLEAEKTRLRENAKEEARKLVKDTRREMELLIGELRETAKTDPRTLERAIQNARDGVRLKEDGLISEKKFDTVFGEPLKSVSVGQRVHIRSVDQEASVLTLPDSKGDIQVQAGMIKMKVKIGDLTSSREKPKKQGTGSKIELHQKDRSFLELDLRGMIVDDAILEIDRFIDDADLSGIKEISLIHGKGTGALRTGVQAYLKKHPRVKSYRIGAYGEGDAGVTVVTLK